MSTPPPTSSLLSAWPGCGDRRPLGEASRPAGEGELLLCEEYARGTCAQRINTAQNRPRLRGCPFSQRLFRPPLSVADSTIPGQASPVTWTLHGRYAPDPPLSPTSTTTPSSPLRLSVSILQSPLPPIPVSPPSPGRHHPVRDTSLELGQDGDPNGLGRTATIDWPWYLPWPIADASYI